MMETGTEQVTQKQIIVFLDCGDTIIDEGTEIRDEHGDVISGDVIPGADQMVRELAERGHTLALVADGRVASFRNLLTQHGLIDYFSARIYSEVVGVVKPDRLMFEAAMEALGLNDADRTRIIMVGNNLSRDIRGANAMGITSVFLQGSPRYPTQSEHAEESPDYTISRPLELLDLVAQLEQDYGK